MGGGFFDDKTYCPPGWCVCVSGLLEWYTKRKISVSAAKLTRRRGEGLLVPKAYTIRYEESPEAEGINMI